MPVKNRWNSSRKTTPWAGVLFIDYLLCSVLCGDRHSACSQGAGIGTQWPCQCSRSCWLSRTPCFSHSTRTQDEIFPSLTYSAKKGGRHVSHHVFSGVNAPCLRRPITAISGMSPPHLGVPGAFSPPLSAWFQTMGICHKCKKQKHSRKCTATNKTPTIFNGYKNETNQPTMPWPGGSGGWGVVLHPKVYGFGPGSGNPLEATVWCFSLTSGSLPSLSLLLSQINKHKSLGKDF